MSDQRTSRTTDEQSDAATGGLPPLVRFLGLHLALGAAIAIAFVSVIILVDLGGLRKLLITAQDPVIPLLLLYCFNVITFSSVAMGIGIMSMPLDAPEATGDVPEHEPLRATRPERLRRPRLAPAARSATELSSRRNEARDR